MPNLFVNPKEGIISICCWVNCPFWLLFKYFDRFSSDFSDMWLLFLLWSDGFILPVPDTT